MVGQQSSNERPRLHLPRRPREIVLPAPLGDVFTDTKANLVPPPSGGSLSVSTPPHASRTVSNTTVPGIEVQTPVSNLKINFFCVPYNFSFWRLPSPRTRRPRDFLSTQLWTRFYLLRRALIDRSLRRTIQTTQAVARGLRWFFRTITSLQDSYL